MDKLPLELRDYFAAAVLDRCVRIIQEVDFGTHEFTLDTKATELAYRIADGMLRERMKGGAS